MSDLMQLIKDYIQDAIGAEYPPSDNDNLEELGLDSLDAIEMVMYIEDQLSITIEDEIDFRKEDTVQDAYEKVQSYLEDE